MSRYQSRSSSLNIRISNDLCKCIYRWRQKFSQLHWVNPNIAHKQANIGGRVKRAKLTNKETDDQLSKHTSVGSPIFS